MKRHESIVALSREHHFGLLFCWKIRMGIKKMVQAKRIKPYVEYFWNNYLQPHFEEEERLLFSSHDSLVERAISEHRDIRELVNAIITLEAVQTDQLKTLADALDIHIRFEERILFPHLEKKLPENTLIRIGEQLQLVDQMREKDDYPDEFWV